MCDAWREEVDKLLIFAGLFSAAVTAFTIESYQWLTEDPNDLTLHALAQISQQLRSAGLGNVTISNLSPEPFTPSPSVVRVNVFWFLSLTLSLATVLIGILCMQWLREYQRETTLSYKGGVALRQMRHEGFVAWGVPEILSLLPLLLQTALILFFAGLLDLLLSLNTVVATFIITAVGLVLLFLVITTIAPTLQYIITPISNLRIAQCPFKSPQSWAFHRVSLTLVDLVPQRFVWSMRRSSARLARLWTSLHDSNWTDFDIHWRHMRDATKIRFGMPLEIQDGGDLVHGLSWIHKTFTQSVDVVYPIYHCFRDLESSAAVQAVSETYPDFAGHFHELLDDPRSPYNAQTRREILSTIVLGFYVHTHPSLEIYNLESQIRITNTVGILWFDPSLHVLHKVSDGSSSYLPASVPPDLLRQFLSCLKTYFSHDVSSIEKAVDIWDIINHLLGDWQPGAHEHAPKWSFAMMEEYEKWLGQSKELEQRKFRVQLCVSGMVTVFRRNPGSQRLWTTFPEFQHALSLVRTLDKYVAEMGGISRMRKELGWIDLGLDFDEREWKNLVNTIPSKYTD
ncbi:hypothetical protein D9615_007003 [Tricholomella constricta]|uniref:DUF6535 domain-containing protein n=1 Tax=Tricholomella constricta TaxID=117010 RepID=A0A8H5M2W6_9AGAR|nr:hypothetical protein D9615_007003 [Tricholomella constricta]